MALQPRSELQYHFPRVKPPKAMSPIRAMISPIQKLQKIIRTIPTMAMTPPVEMPAIPRSPDLATASSSESASLQRISLRAVAHLHAPAVASAGSDPSRTTMIVPVRHRRAGGALSAGSPFTAPWGRGSTSHRRPAPERCARGLPEMPMLTLLHAERSVRPGGCPHIGSGLQKTRWGRPGPHCEHRSCDRSCVRSLAPASRSSGVDFPCGGTAIWLGARQPTQFGSFLPKVDRRYGQKTPVSCAAGRSRS